MKRVINRGAFRRFPVLRKPVRAAVPAKENQDVLSMSGLSLTFEPFYRVVLVYSDWVNDKPIAQKVRYSVPIITATDAVNVVKRARAQGKAIVVTVIKDDAIMYMNNLKTKGLDVIIDEA